MINFQHLLKTIVRTIYDLSYPVVFSMPFRHVRYYYIKLFIKEIGENTYIGRCVDIRSPWNICIGTNCVVNKRVLLDGRGELVIGNNVDIAQEANIWTEQHNYNDDYHCLETGKVIIADYVWISSRSAVLPGVTLNRGCVVACGAVVTKDVKSMDVVGGIPAKQISIRRSQLLYQLNFKARLTF